MARDDLRGFWKPDKKTKELLSRKSNLHAEDYREDAVAEEIDRQIALEAMRLGL